MAKIAKIGTVRIPCVALPSVALPVVGLRGASGGGAADYWPAGTPEAIRQACMLWYDIARQGCTNETMAANPVLRDLSGNGHDAECFNFAWSGMSGIGGYYYKFHNYNNNYKGTYTDTMLNVTKMGNEGGFEILNYDGKNKRITVKITGLEETGMGLMWGGSPYMSDPVYTDGIHTFEALNDLPVGNAMGFKFTNHLPEGSDVNITIEQLPLYPGALVSDGVDDYCHVEGLPLLTKENGYTVACRRVILDNPTRFSVASKCMDALHLSGILFEAQDSTNKFVQTLSGNLIIDGFESGEVSWLSSQIYNGSPLNGTAERADNEFLILFKFHKNGGYGNVVLYSFALFDRDLTEEEIEWVKTNMMQQ